MMGYPSPVTSRAGPRFTVPSTNDIDYNRSGSKYVVVNIAFSTVRMLYGYPMSGRYSEGIQIH
jgi:hypothetical protein